MKQILTLIFTLVFYIGAHAGEPGGFTDTTDFAINAKPQYKSGLYPDDHNCKLDAISIEIASVTQDRFLKDIIDPSTAVNYVEDHADFKIENGVVTSAGQIVVYNVAGQVVATASQSFEVSSLSKGVFFITAQEGTIKLIKIQSK